MADKLGLRPAPVSTQVIIRDGVAEFALEGLALNKAASSFASSLSAASPGPAPPSASSHGIGGARRDVGGGMSGAAAGLGPSTGGGSGGGAVLKRSFLVRSALARPFDMRFKC